MLDRVIIYTDSGARNNPGSAALGLVVFDEQGRVLTEHGSKRGLYGFHTFRRDRTITTYDKIGIPEGPTRDQVVQQEWLGAGLGVAILTLATVLLARYSAPISIYKMT